MNEHSVSGYLIVAPRKAGALYAGVDRDPWDAISDAYYARELSEEESRAWEALRPNDVWWPTSDSTHKLSPFEAFLERRGVPFDILAVGSDFLQASRGKCVLATPEPIFMGFDVVAVGEWSLVRALLESSANPSIAGVVNQFGLLTDPAQAALVAAAHSEAATKNEVEPLGGDEPRLPVEVVSVFSVTRREAP